MADDTSIFGSKPEQVDRLFRRAFEKTEAKDEAPPTAALDTIAEKPGGRIDRYKLLRLLGEGGMGIVYLAEQEEPVRRQVALKVIKPGMDSKRVIARFEAEQRALALTEHPHVARVYDAGLTLSGRPYFVMEYVKGIPITEHCDKRKLTIEERLRLFLHVCEAIQHAHQKGIIHRDIKPSNILVTIEDNEAVPKVIDFGVARAVSQPLTERTLYTEEGQLIGTPEYMSPEQAEPSNQDIDTRTDIYSLGAVLYELLAGALPFDPQTLREGGIDCIRRVICEEDPKTPSTRLGEISVEDSAESARRRSTETKALQRRLHGDLDWITLKAMEKDRTRRYGSAGELAADVRRHLSHEPVLAGPPSTVYKMRKFVRRNRTLVTGIAVVLVVLLAGVVVSTLLAIGQARARAEAQAVSDFLLKSVLGSLDLWDMRGQEITVRSVLDAASQGLEGELADQPLVEARIRWTLASSYTWLGLYEPAELHAKRALEIRRAQLGTEHLATVLSVFELGWVYFYASRYNEAAPLLADALESMEQMLSEERGGRLYCMATLGWVYNMQGRFHEAEQLFKGGLATVHRVWGEENEHVPTFLQGLGFTYQMQGHYEEAGRLYGRGLEISRRVRGQQDWETLNLVHTLGELYGELGRPDQAEQLLLEALDGKRRMLGEQHSSTLLAMGTLGWLYHNQGRYDQAESLFVEALQTSRRAVGETHICCLRSMMELGDLYLSQGRYSQAESVLAEALEMGRPVLGEENWPTLRTMNTLARLYTARSRYDEAEELFGETLAARQRNLGDDHPETLETISDFGVLRRQQQHYEEAESLLRYALDGRQHKLGPDHPACFESKHELALLYIAKEAYEKATPLLLDACNGRKAKLGPNHPHSVNSLNQLVSLYESWNKPDEAARWRAKLPPKEATEE